MEHGGKIFQYAKTIQRAVGEIVDASANINPLGPPHGVQEAIVKAFDTIRHYPDSDHEEIRCVIADRFVIEKDAVLCGNGASECIEILIKGLSPTRVIVLEPAFSEYCAAATRLSCPVVSCSLFDGDAFTLPLSQLDSMLHRGDLLFINHPHNPSGSSWPLSSWITEVFSWANRGVLVAIDESFADFLPQGDPRTLIHYAATTPNLFVIRSATKIFSIPGLRFGFLVTIPEKIATLKTYRDPWSVNQFAQRAALISYQDQRFLMETATWLKNAHCYVQDTWGRDDRWKFFPTAVNFFLLRFASPKAARLVQAKLREEGIFVRSCENFAGLTDAYVRIALLSPNDNERIFRAVCDAI